MNRSNLNQNETEVKRNFGAFTSSDSAFSVLESLRRTHGLQFVLTKDKVPAWKGYRERRPGTLTVLKHLAAGGDVGFFPYTIHTAILDVDFGPWQELTDAVDSRLILSTRRGAHLLFDCNQRRKDTKWQYRQCGGDLKSNGFVKLHAPESLGLLDATLYDRKRSGVWLPIPEQIELALIDPRTPAKLEQKHKASPADRVAPVGPAQTDFGFITDAEREAMQGLSPPSGSAPGNRHDGLLTALQEHARTLDALGDVDMLGDLQRKARALNACISSPLEAAQVEATAGGVAAWVKPRPEITIAEKAAARFSALQRSRQARGRAKVRERNRKRDQSIIAAAPGLSFRENAEKHGVSLGCIQKVLRREKSNAGTKAV